MEMTLIRNIIFNTISIEITRRCNLVCDFCSRGKAQNLTITKEIIDKALAELKDCYIYSVRLNGGEPFLEPDMIEYLVNQIIKKEISLCSLFVFTNCTIKDKRIAKSLNQISEYITELRQKDKKLQNMHSFISSHQDKDWTKNVTIIFSTNGHPTTAKQITETRDWYIDHLDSNNISCLLQDRRKRVLRTTPKNDRYILVNGLIIDGRGLLNYEKLLKEPVDLTEICLNDNHYSFINDISVIPNDDTIYKCIEEAITIGANGNVFVGCLMSYARVDTEKMFNIIDCCNDFYEKIDAWCWLYPMNSLSHESIGLYRNYDFCKEKGLKMRGEVDKSRPYIDRKIAKYYCIKDWITKTEEVARILHKKYKNLNHVEIIELSIFIAVFRLCEQKYPIDMIEFFISMTFGDHKKSYSHHELKKICDNVISEIIKRNDDLEYAEQDRKKLPK